MDTMFLKRVKNQKCKQTIERIFHVYNGKEVNNRIAQESEYLHHEFSS